MADRLAKRIWNNFSEKLGVTIIHPQFTLLKFQMDVIEEVKKHAKGKLVDIGCGRMFYRKEIEPFVDSYIGVDHPVVSKLYNSKIKPDVFADAKKLPFDNNSFDTALLLQVLEHVDDPKLVVEEAARILKKSGVLVISVPFFYPLHDMPHDWGRYTKTALESFVKSTGLKIVKLETQGSFIQFWPQMLNTFLIKRINDILSTRPATLNIILLLLISALSLPIILFNNLLIILLTFIASGLPKFPNYFPLDYLLVAKKK